MLFVTTHLRHIYSIIRKHTRSPKPKKKKWTETLLGAHAGATRLLAIAIRDVIPMFGSLCLGIGALPTKSVLIRRIIRAALMFRCINPLLHSCCPRDELIQILRRLVLVAIRPWRSFRRRCMTCTENWSSRLILRTEDLPLRQAAKLSSPSCKFHIHDGRMNLLLYRS